MMYAVCVTFKLNDNDAADFMPLILENARISRASEAGCLQFDVLRDPDKTGMVFLYEVYTDRAAFDAHLASAHFQRFDAVTTAMISTKDVQTWTQVTQ